MVWGFEIRLVMGCVKYILSHETDVSIGFLQAEKDMGTLLGEINTEKTQRRSNVPLYVDR